MVCQRAENEFVGAHVGIMDQFVSCHGRANHAILLDCQSLSCRYLPVPGHIRLVVCDTMVRHDLAAGEYNVRRQQCEAGVEALRKAAPEIHSLRDVTPEQLNALGGALDPVIYRRCRHVVTENARVLAAAGALEAGHLSDFGKLMIESHQSLRDDYEVSSPELDAMVELSLQIGREIGGVYGARMTGGGFGGCTINLVERDSATEFVDSIAPRYEKQTGRKCAVYICAASEGATEVTSE
jgi:galactokinase